MIKIVFLDFDNTIYDHKHGGIPTSAISSINNLKKKNIIIVLCTGRSFLELTKFDLTKIPYDIAITLNGHMILNNKGEVIKATPIKEELKERLITLFNKKEIPIGLITENDIYINYISDHVKKIQKEISSPLPTIRPYDMKEFYMGFAYIENDNMKKIIESLNDVATVTYWGKEGVDIIDKQISKGSGVKEILNHFNLRKEDSLSIGDAENDIAMFKETHVSIAMGNANEKTKESATYVTDLINEDGLSNALNKYIIN